MDDETFAALLGEDTETPATTGPSAADETAIEAAVPDGEDVPEDDGAESDEDDQTAEDDVQAEGEDEPETETAPAEPELDISDPRHPHHAVYQEAQAARQQAAIQAQARQEYARIQAVAEIQNAIQGLPDVDPDKLPGVVTGLLSRVVAPVRQEAAAQAQFAEENAAIAASFHLAMTEYLPPEWVQALIARSQELRGFGSVEAASHVVKVGKEVSARENAEIARLRQENALLKKTAKANERNPDADRVPQVRPATPASRTPNEGESDFDRFFNEQVIGQQRP